MVDLTLNELYFKWICSIIFPDETIRNSYSIVLNVLYHTPFEYTLLLDENRKKDGIDLRYHFSCASNIPHNIIDEYFDNNQCSMLEVMTALARRCEDDIMADLAYGDRTSVWFSLMFNNLGLYMFPNSSWNIQKYYEVKDILRRCMYRDYEFDGENGGLFIIKNTAKDLRNLQLWDQMCLFTNTIQ